MVDPEFSERQYEYAMTKQLEAEMKHGSRGRTRFIPYFPTQNEEKHAGYDTEIGALLIQYKRCSLMVGKKTKQYDKNRKEKMNHLPFYRFDLKTSDSDSEWGQHEILSYLGSKGVKTLYAVPEFHEMDEFKEKYKKNSMMSDSVFFDCGSCPSLSNDEDHVVCFYRSPSMGYVLSQERNTIRTVDEELSPDMLLADGFGFENFEQAILEFREIKSRIISMSLGEKEKEEYMAYYQDLSPSEWMYEEMLFFSSFLNTKIQFVVRE